MATVYLQDLRQQFPQGPYMIGGYSFGGIVAYEMAQQLRERGVSCPDDAPPAFLKIEQNLKNFSQFFS